METNCSEWVCHYTRNLSHEKRGESLQLAIDRLIHKVKNRATDSQLPIEKQLEMIDLLAGFELGRFLLERGGFNGYWTDYLVRHPQRGSDTIFSNVLEDFLLNRAPTALATQERFQIFKREIQKRLGSNAALASIPCGLMADLFDLDFTQVSGISLTGIDLDSEAIEGASERARQRGLSHCCQFFQREAWELDLGAAFDFIASNGLSIYEPDDAKVVALYEEFFKALKPGGYLITSFLSMPPFPGLKTGWKLNEVNLEDALLQKFIFSDLLEAKWQIYRSEEEVKSQLEKAGFCDIEIVYDRAHIFPTIIGKKASC